jgi:hypothetical protein
MNVWIGLKSKESISSKRCGQVKPDCWFQLRVANFQRTIVFLETKLHHIETPKIYRGSNPHLYSIGSFTDFGYPSIAFTTMQLYDTDTVQSGSDTVRSDTITI